MEMTLLLFSITWQRSMLQTRHTFCEGNMSANVLAKLGARAREPFGWALLNSFERCHGCFLTSCFVSHLFYFPILSHITKKILNFYDIFHIPSLEFNKQNLNFAKKTKNKNSPQSCHLISHRYTLINHFSICIINKNIPRSLTKIYIKTKERPRSKKKKEIKIFIDYNILFPLLISHFFSYYNV